MLCTQSSSTVFKDINLDEEFSFPVNSLQLQNGMLFLWNKHKLSANLRLSTWYVLCFSVQQWIIKLHVESLPKLKGLKKSCQNALLLLEVKSFVVYRSCFCTTRQRGRGYHEELFYITVSIELNSLRNFKIKKTELHTLKIFCSGHKDLR